MNKNLIITALLVALVCQPVSAATSSLGESLQKTLISAVGLGVFGGVVVTALAVAGYKYVTKEKVWVEGNCVKFRKCTPFGTEAGSFCFRTSEEAVAAKGFVDTSRHGLPRLKEMGQLQKTNPNVVWTPRVMTDAEAQKFLTDVRLDPKEHARAVKSAIKRAGFKFQYYS